jgi:N-acetylglucosamine malate deacetylase 1
MAKLRILVIGAHPDDPDITCGGSAALWSRAGHVVKFLSLTNGDTGHHAIGGIELARRRHAEAQASARACGIAEYQIIDQHCGELEATLANRKTVIRIMREFRPDLIITHRPYDYHPDHRATSTLVMDASYIVTVPNMLSLTDILEKAPRICYAFDRFAKPCPFEPHVVVPIDDVIETKIDMLDCHESQFYEWLAFNRGVLDQVPAGRKARRKWLAEQRLPDFARIADTCRDRLIELLGEKAGRAVRYAEAFEACEYGANVDPRELARLFPMPATRAARGRASARPQRRPGRS